MESTIRDISDEQLAQLIGSGANVYTAMLVRQQCQMEDLLDEKIDSFNSKKLIKIYDRAMRRASNMFRG